MLYDEAKKQNVTISYQQALCPYHHKIAQLVDKFATPDQHTILDVGCGAGNTLLAIDRLQRKFTYAIADIDPHCIEITQAKVPVQRAHQLSSCRNLDRIDELFDIILMSHVLQYDEQPTATMKQLLGMLRPGGFIVAATPNPASLPILLNNLLRRDYVKGNAFIWDRSVFRNFLTNTVGGEIHTMSEDYVPLPVVTRYRLFRPLELTLAKVMPWFAFSIIAVVGNKRGA